MIDEPERAAAAGGDASRAAALGALLVRLSPPRAPVSAREQPAMLATLADRPFSRADWLFEVKYDGVRVFAERRDDQIELRGRSGQIVTGRYPEIAGALRALPASQFLLDGEIVAFDEAGHPSFQRLQARMGLADPRDVALAASRVEVTGVFFDCLAVEGYDLRRLPLLQRKQCLALLMASPPAALQYSDHVPGEGQAFYDAVCERGLEGIVAKRASGSYAGGRSRDWVKIKCHRRQAFVIGGYTDPQGTRGYFGALHLGLYDRGRLVYVSKVGGGFDHAGLRRLWETLQPLARRDSPFEVGTPAGRGHHWVEPQLVCEVRYTDWTRDGGIRHPIFLGLRSDKRPEECQREAPQSVPGLDGPDDSASLPAAAATGGDGKSEGTVKLSNVRKVFWPAEGYTKGDLIAYYDRVAPRLLPYLRDRPVVLTRFPDGIAGKSFFQQDAPHSAPSWVRRQRIHARDAGREIDYFVIDGADALRYVVNLGTIPLHVWSARVASLGRPDWLVLDLDPKGAPFAHVIRVARTLRRLLDDLELASYVKTSGATGLHIMVPLGARYSHDEATSFARLLAILGAEAAADIATVARPLRARGGRVYIDAGQNGAGKTIVAPYAVRPLPGAPVSCPLHWDEVTSELDPGRFTIRTAVDRFDAIADPMAPVLTGGIDLAAALARADARLGR